MKFVNTVCGPVAADQLGSTLMHEHLVASSMGVANNYRVLYGENYEGRIIDDLEKMKAEDIKTVVDATPACLGRDVKTLQSVAKATGMNIIATSGWWGCKPPYSGNIPAEKWAEAFIQDLTIGCDGTDIKAGILKAAMDKDGPTDWRKTCHRAVGMASVETGAKIMLHTYCPTETPRHQLALLKEVGVDMNNVVVDHIPETTDMDFIQWIYDQGVWMGIDRMPIMLFPGEYCVATETRIKTIKKMLDLGMGDRMLFSHDFMTISSLHDYMPEEVHEYLAAQIPDRYLFLKKHVFPRLAELGADFDTLWNYTIDNPRKFFEG